MQTNQGLRRFAGLLVAVLIVAFPGSARTEPVSARDVAGREIALPAPATRIVVGSAMNLDALALAHPDPIALIAGWSGLAGTMDEAQAAALRAAYPAVDAIPLVGRLSLDTLSVETLVSLDPDLAVLNLYDLAGSASAPAASPLVLKLTNAGIPVVIVDFFVDPLANASDSLRALGDLLDTAERVDAFLAFYDEHMGILSERLAAQGDALDRPRVFLHAHAAGPDCCFSPGRGALDGFIRAAGGHNVGAEILSTPTGQVALETLLTLQPDIYVATGGYARGSKSGFTLGRAVDPAEAQAGLSRLLERPGLAALSAVGDGRTHGLWHDFTHSPLHIIGVEAMARWFQPDLFADIDPQATLDEINARFLAIPLAGTFWVDSPR